MIPLHIDIGGIVDEFALTASQAEDLGSAIIDRITAEYTTKWEGLVNAGLKGTRNLYKKAMFVNRISPMEVEFGLNEGEHGLALALEEGKAPWDEKGYFQNSKKAKRKPNGGWYLTVPFHYATPDAVAESILFQGVLPREIYDIAKGNSGKPVSYGQLPDQYSQLGKRAEINYGGIIIPEYVHKAPTFQGLVRIEASATEKEKRGGYFTFRRVSDRSDPISWIHPGFDAKLFMDKAIEQAQVAEVADMAIDKFLSQL